MPVIPVPIPSSLLERLVERAADRTVDYMVDRVPVAAGAALRALKGALRNRDSVEAANAAAALSQAVADEPRSLDVLTNPPYTKAREDVPLIEIFRDFLDYEMTLIDQLGRPVALPGFFNSSECLVVIDTRKLIGAGTEPIRGRYTRGGALSEVTFPIDGSPRIWVLPADRESRDQLVDEFNALFETDSPKPLALVNQMNDHASPERVTAITDGQVKVSGEGHDPAWYAIGDDTEGIKLFRSELAGMVKASLAAAQARHAVWAGKAATLEPEEPDV